MNDSTGLFEDYKRARDGGALARLVQHHQDAVLRVCRRVLRHPQDAEDACQEVLLELSRQAGSIQEPGAFSAWLYRTALHTALDHRRKRGRDRLRDSRARVAEPTSAPPGLNETLAEGLERLDDASRALLVEHYLAGRPLRELAAERGVSEVAVWKRLRNVRDRLKSSIGSVALAALEEGAGSFWTRLLTLKAAVAVPLGIAAVVGIVVVARPAKPDAPETPKKPVTAVAAPVRLAPAAASASTPAPAAGAAVVVALPTPPKPPAPRKPWPYKEKDVAIPGGAQWAWSVLRTSKVTIDRQGASMEQVLDDIAKQTGLRFRIDPGLVKSDVSFKVQEIVADGALRLMLVPSRRNYEIEADGMIRVGMEDDIKGGFERTAREAEAARSTVDWVEAEMNRGWDGLRDLSDRTPQIEAAMARKIQLPQGETTLRKEADRLAKVDGVHVLIDGTPSPESKAGWLQPVVERTLREHLDELARRSGLTLLPQSEEMYLLADPDRVAQEREAAKKEREKYEDTLAVLQRPLTSGGPYTVQDFAETAAAALEIPVIPNEKAWTSETSFSIPPGATLRQALDAIKAQGFRWALHEGKLYILQ